MGQEPDRVKLAGPAEISALRADIERERDALGDAIAELERRRHAGLGWTRKLGARKGFAIAAGVGVAALIAGAFLLRRSPAARMALAAGKRSRPWLSTLGKAGLAAATALASARRRGEDAGAGTLRR